MTKTLVKLDEVCEIKSGYAFNSSLFENNGIPIIRIGDLNGEIVNINNTVFYPFSFWEKHPEYRIEKGDILIAMSGATVGKVGLFSYDSKALLNQRVCLLRAKKDIDKNYLYLFCLSPNFRKYIEMNALGCAQPNISIKQISNIEINIEDINNQKEISNILQNIMYLISLRTQQLEQLDLLIKSRFVEMFGDPVRNEKGWELKRLKEICNKITDGTHDTPKRVKDGYLLITGKNIRSSGIIFEEIEYVSTDDHKIIYARCNPEYGDVLYTNIGVNFCTACFNNLNYEFSMKNVALLKPNKAILNGKYLWLTLNLLRNKIIEENKVGGAQTFLGLATIKMIEVPLPPLALQTLFAAFIEEVEKTKVTVKQSLEWLNTLKAKLMQDYFG